MSIVNANQGTLIRAVIRTAIVLATAFGFNWTAEQVAAVQLAAEAILQAAVQWDQRT